MVKLDIKSFLIGIIIGIVVSSLLSYSAVEEVTPEKPVSQNLKKGIEVTIPLGADVDQLVSPNEGDLITSPFVVAGSLFVFENQFTISVFDANGKELGQKLGYAHSPDIGQPGPFVELVSFADSTTKDGTVKIWSTSAKDGSREVLFSVSVKFY